MNFDLFLVVSVTLERGEHDGNNRNRERARQDAGIPYILGSRCSIRLKYQY
jgi:hypothetical protein